MQDKTQPEKKDKPEITHEKLNSEMNPLHESASLEGLEILHEGSNGPLLQKEKRV